MKIIKKKENIYKNFINKYKNSKMKAKKNLLFRKKCKTYY